MITKWRLLVYNPNMHSSKKTLFFLGLIIVLAAFFRLWDLKSVPPGLYPDEAMNGNNALYALESGNFSSFYSQNNGREGLFINIQAFAIKTFGNEPWTLRMISGFFGIFTVLGVFFLGRELFRGLKGGGRKIFGFEPEEIIGLGAAFFMAVSFWHINFSRIGFRAVMAPFFIVWALYFLLVSFREEISAKFQIFTSLAGGFFLGLGAHSYIAYRLAPFLILPAAFRFLRNKRNAAIFLLFILAAFIAFLPLGIYFLKNPSDFLGRTSQISVFSSKEPLKAFALNLVKTAGSFWFEGDYNPRHNFPGAPQLWPPVGVFLAVGLVAGIFKRGMPIYLLWLWLVLFSLPVVFSAEGLPHALRSILLLPPLLIFAAFGFWKILDCVRERFEAKAALFPAKERQVGRIRLEWSLLVALFLAAHIITVYSDYFVRWANTPEVYFAFNGNYARMGRWLNRQDKSTPKYVIINSSGVLAEIPDAPSVRPLPMPSQTIMFLTDSWSAQNQKEKNINYLLPEEIGQADCPNSCLIFALEPDPNLNAKIKETFKDLKVSIEPGFAVFYKNAVLR